MGANRINPIFGTCEGYPPDMMIINPYAFAAAPSGGTNWVNDASCYGVYYFEGTGDTSAMGTNSKANENHFANNVTAAYPSADTTNFKEGSQGALFSTTGADDALKLTLSGATTGFPFKAAGTAEFTIGGWVRFTSLPGAYVYFFRCGTAFLRILSGQPLLRFDGSTAANISSGTTLSTNTWYFIACVYSDSANRMYLYIYPDGGTSTWEGADIVVDIGTLDTGTDFFIGATTDSAASECPNGTFDAVAIFNGKAFSKAELDDVVTNGWDGNRW